MAKNHNNKKIGVVVLLVFSLFLLSFVSATQCNDRVDNDGDGLIDALVENDDISTNVVLNGDAFCKIMTEESDLYCDKYQHFRDNILTASQVCELTSKYYIELGLDKPYIDYVSYTSKGYASWWNDFNYQWLGDNWNRYDASYNSRYLTSVTCSGGSVTACNDGIDNDDDGLIDYPEDGGCASVNDVSEIAHDPDCDETQCDSDVEQITLGYNNIPVKGFEIIGNEEGILIDKYYHYGNTVNTAEELCALTEEHYEAIGLDKPYPAYVSKTGKGYDNCWNDYNNVWNSGAWSVEPACSIGSYLTFVVCESVPEC